MRPCFRMIIGVLLLTAAGMSSGCGLKERFGGPATRQAAVQPVIPAAGRVDSLFSSALPADTLFLAEQTGNASAPLAPDVAPLRLGPSSAEVIGQQAVWGWRVQLASSSDLEALETLVNRVEREFGSVAYLVDLGGYWVLRIGAFDNQDAAERERDRAVSYGYKNAWIVQTGIPPHQIQREE